MSCRTQRPPHAQAGTLRRHEAPGHLMGIATTHRTASARAPRRPAKPAAGGQRDCTSTRRPAHRYATPRSKPHRRVPTGSLREHAPPRLALGAKTRPRSLARKGRENFSECRKRSSENSDASAFRFHPLRCRFPAGAIRTTGRAKGRAPTRGGRQPWERASTRGRTRQSART